MVDNIVVEKFENDVHSKNYENNFPKIFQGIFYMWRFR